MTNVRLIHWRASEALPLVEALRAADYKVDYEEKLDSGLFHEFRDSPPAAFVIDLSRLPSHGREVATALRGYKPARLIPIVFVNGAPEKVEAVRKVLPDAVYTDTAGIAAALREAIANPPDAPVKPPQMMERYSTRTTAQKLGIAEGSTVAVIDPPRDYAKAIGALPAGVQFIEDAGEPGDITLWFVTDADSFHAALTRMRKLAAKTRLWVAWPKQAARRASISMTIIRDAALAAGLVDYKICSMSNIWSAILFAPKKK